MFRLIRSPIYWLNRHPVFYKIRFKLVSKTSNPRRIEDSQYRDWNRKQEIPDIYYQINRRIFPEGTHERSHFEIAIKISKWLRQNITGGPGLGLASDQALYRMLYHSEGVCSDFAQVFNNFCLINDIDVKEWGTTRLPLGQWQNGHSFNEIYCNKLKKWILIDVSKSLFFSKGDIPLSVMELFTSIDRSKAVCCETFGPKQYLHYASVKDTYLDPRSVPFAITNYCNKIYDSFLNLFGFLPTPMVHGLIYISQRSYAFEFPLWIKE